MSVCTIITVTYNAAKWLPEFIESIRSIRQFTKHKIYVLAIDNNSTDETRLLLRAASRDLEYIPNSANLGFAVATNQGIRIGIERSSDYILLLNNDTVPPPALVDRLIATAQQMHADFVSAKLVAMECSAEVSYCGAQVNRKFGFRVVPQRCATTTKPFFTGYAPAAALLVTASTFERIGLMDERIFVYADDLDLMIRATNIGLRVAVDPGCVVRHATGSSTGGPDSDFTIQWSSYGRAIVAATHSRGWNRMWQALYLGMWTLACFVLRRTSLSSTRLRMTGLYRGWRVGRKSAPRIDPR